MKRFTKIIQFSWSAVCFRGAYKFPVRKGRTSEATTSSVNNSFFFLLVVNVGYNLKFSHWHWPLGPVLDPIPYFSTQTCRKFCTKTTYTPSPSWWLSPLDPNTVSLPDLSRYAYTCSVSQHPSNLYCKVRAESKKLGCCSSAAVGRCDSVSRDGGCEQEFHVLSTVELPAYGASSSFLQHTVTLNYEELSASLEELFVCWSSAVKFHSCGSSNVPTVPLSAVDRAVCMSSTVKPV